LCGALPLAFGALLVACGGGGGGSGSGDEVVYPPGTPATLSATTDNAAGAAAATVATADAAANRSGSLGSLSVFLGAPVGAQQTPTFARERPLTVQTAQCSDIFDTYSCSGTARLDTNIDPNASTIPAGAYIDVTFSALSGVLFGDSYVFNGRLRLEFESGFNPNSGSDAGLDVLLKLYSLDGSVNGSTFGPFSDVGRLTVTSGGNATITAGGATYSHLSGVSVTSAGNYDIGSAQVRVGYWSNSGAYVDVNLSNWHVSGRRPTVGSTATVTAGTGSVSINVTSSSAATVVYRVVITVGGSATTYTVTATYSDSGSPNYAAVQVFT
jgi:hypothetical protein